MSKCEEGLSQLGRLGTHSKATQLGQNRATKTDFSGKLLCSTRIQTCSGWWISSSRDLWLLTDENLGADYKGMEVLQGWGEVKEVGSSPKHNVGALSLLPAMRESDQSP